MTLLNTYKQYIFFLAIVSTFSLFSSKSNVPSKVSILFVTKEFPSAYQPYILNDIIGAKQNGHSCAIYAQTKGEAEDLEPLIKAHKLDQITHYILPDMKLYNVVCCEWEDQGKVYAAIKKDNINTIPNLIIRFRGHPDHHSAYMFAFSSAVKLLPINTYFKNQLLKAGYDKNKITVVPSGIISKNFICEDLPLLVRDRQQYTKESWVAEVKPFQILSIEHSTTQKSKHLINAINHLIHDKNIAVEASIIGEKHRQLIAKNYITRKNFALQINSAEEKNQHQIKQCLAQTHIFVLPIITSQTTISDDTENLLKEVMLANIPIVTTDSTQDLITDMKTGFLVSEEKMKKDTSGKILADGIYRVMTTNNEDLTTICQTAQEKVKREYDIDVTATQFSTLIQKIIHPRTPVQQLAQRKTYFFLS